MSEVVEQMGESIIYVILATAVIPIFWLMLRVLGTI